VRSTPALLAVVVLVGLAWASPAWAVKIACVGDSITYGYGLGNRAQESWPSVLQTLVGSKHTVQNFGSSGCTLLKKGDKPYWNDPAFGASDSFKPDIAIVMLGTNDAKPQNWSHKAEFAADYGSMIDHYRGLGATVYVAVPPPVFSPGAFDIDPDVLNNEIVPLIRTIATDASAPLIDVFAALSGKGSLFPDTVHPNVEGSRQIAQTVAAALDAGTAGGTGGTSGTGGAGGTVSGSGGFTGTGGTANGSGGASTSIGGQTGGSGGVVGGSGGAGTQTGGAPGTGGRSSGVGGTSSAGGTRASGGSSGAGGMVAQGGQAGGGQGGNAGTDSGGSGAGGGRGGSSASGGAGLGGTSGSGGASTSTATPSGSSGGCGCRTLGDGQLEGKFGIVLAFLAFVVLARRRRTKAHG
jgi:acyl-CoA thioesterase-1